MHQFVKADAGEHVIAGTSLDSGYVKFTDGQNNVLTNGIPTVRHDSQCMVNCNSQGVGGAKGKVITLEKIITPFVAWSSKWSKKLYVKPGAIKNAYDTAWQEIQNPNNTWIYNTVYGTGILATAGGVAIEEVGRAIANIPSSALGAVPLASEGGELIGMATDATLSKEDRILAGIKATGNFSNSFLGLLDLAVAIKMPIDAAKEKPPGIYVRKLPPGMKGTDNKSIREWYNEVTHPDRLKKLNEKWEKEGKSLEERARLTYEERHNARLTAREYMENPQEVADLRARDMGKYGNPDGPTFNQEYNKYLSRGQASDESYRSIIEGASRTNKEYNDKFGVKK